MKKILVMAVAVVSAAVAQASYLYWQTGTDTSFNGHEIAGYQLAVTGGDSGTIYLTPTYTDGTSVDHVAAGATVFGGDSEYKIDVSAYSGSQYAFYVELIGYDQAAYGTGTGVIGVSETQTYAQLMDKGSIVNAGLTKIPVMWTGGSVAAPEPTSAMMILLGLAGLALKRKQV